ncbi:Uncharacterised protein [Mycobacteroides abscessus subsp. abscessus]|nr:Uncharacterised protein [Mycobacteroides abscessus subsp. abscessus]
MYIGRPRSCGANTNGSMRSHCGLHGAAIESTLKRPASSIAMRMASRMPGAEMFR